jgi:hypothetical protein
MAEYIERGAALDICEKYYQHCLKMHDWNGDSVAYDIKADIKNLPTADVVEVVRCRDCVYMLKPWGKVLCAKKVYSDDYSVKVLTPTNLDNFCNYGARMTERRADNG